MTDDMKKPPRKGPPKGKRFGADNPGPRKGRTKGARNVKSIVRDIARMRHPVTIDGRVQRKSTIELLLLTLLKKAMAGDVRAAQHVDRLRDRHGPVEEKRSVLVVSDDMSPEEWMRRAEIQNRFRKKPPTMDEAAGFRRPDPAI